MCLSLAIHRPSDVLATGEHLGFEWSIIANRRSLFRCGYVRVPPGHPWHGRHHNSFEQPDVDDVLASVQVKNDLSFSEADQSCNKGGEDNAWWLGFHCGDPSDAPDPSLITDEHGRFFWDTIRRAPLPDWMPQTLWTTEMVEAECRSLCEQAARAAIGVTT
jgi:hypothetical protein